MELFASLLQALRRGAWAPLSVLVLHQICTKAGWRSHSDWPLHFLGGLAIAIFLHHLISAVDSSASKWLHLAQTFCAAATVALFWDLAEFASDEILGTEIQHSLRETMLDLCFGVAGAAVCCVGLLVTWNPTTRTPQSPT